MKKQIRYYDPEYDREISEAQIIHQYNWFVANQGMQKSYNQFLKENFMKLDKNNIPFRMV